MDCAVQTDFLDAYKLRADGVLSRILDDNLCSEDGALLELNDAMRYAVTNGGKRVRPTLCYATARALGITLQTLDVPGAAIEIMHAYSLVHDDLPAMDDDDLRRGLPTCHKRFGEATAILAGDALQALAFTALANNQDPKLTPQTRIDMITLLGFASGASGMAAGQAIDLAAVGKTLTLDELQNMHRHKTGKLIRASIKMATLADQSTEQPLVNRLDRFADEIGLLFQIVDDILDVISDTETLGKTQGADDLLNKPTYPALLGLEGARKHADATYRQALQQLDGLGTEFDELRQISTFIIERTY